MRLPQIVAFSIAVVLTAFPLGAQSPNGTINRLILDPENRAIVGADILAINGVTGVKYPGKTNENGIYSVANLPPGPYRLQVSKIGFKTLVKPDIVLNVQDALSINFTLPIGASFETLTVEGGAPLVNTESAVVSTVVDRQFAENLPDFRIRSIERSKDAPWSYVVFGVKEIHRIKNGTEVTDRIVGQYNLPAGRWPHSPNDFGCPPPLTDQALPQ